MAKVLQRVVSLRIATLNVHFFQDAKERLNVFQLANLLEPLELDVLAVQEALHTDQPEGAAKQNRYHFRRLAQLLNFPHLTFCNVANDFGNGLLSKYPITKTNCFLTEDVEGHNGRGMLAARIDHPFFEDNQATLYVTHLDQIDEDVRLTQMQSLEEQISSNSDEQLRLIVGDFNALTFEDYSADYFRQRIRDVRERHGWEPPFDRLTKTLKQNGYEDCWRWANPECIDERAMTCAYQTRIDYIWKRGTLKHGWTIEECRIFPTHDATDHHGVLITLSKALPQ